MGDAGACFPKRGEHQTLKAGRLGELRPLSPCEEGTEEGRRVPLRESRSSGPQGLSAQHRARRDVRGAASGEVTSVSAAPRGLLLGH